MPITAHFWITCDDASPEVGATNDARASDVARGRRAHRMTIGPQEEFAESFARLPDPRGHICSELALTPIGPFNWRQPDPSWVAVVLDAFDGGLVLNRETDFESDSRTADYGRIPRGARLHAHDRPIGHVYDVGGELVISQSMREMLGDAVSCHGSIEQDGSELSDFFRFEPRVQRELIDPLSYQPPQPCKGCGATWSPLRGTWFSMERTPLQETAIWSVPGYGHFRAEYPLVISLSIALQIHQRFRGKGYTMEPVFGADSPEYQRARNMIAQFPPINHPRG